MENHINNLLTRSVQHLELGDIKSAETLASNALKLQPKNLNALNIMGAIKGLQGKTQECVQIFKELAKKLPRDGQIQFNLAKAMSDDNQDFQALRHHELAINLMPKNPNAWVNYGVSLNKIKRHENALGAFQKGLQLNPNSPEIWLNLSATLNYLKRFDESISAANNSLQLDPKLAMAWCNLGSAYSSKKQFVNAISSYGRAINIHPHLSEAWEGKARVLLNLNELQGALECANTALQCNPQSAESWVYIGDIQQSLGTNSEAISCYQRALEINPSLTEAQLQTGLCLIKNNEPEKALLEIGNILNLQKEVNYAFGYYLSLKLQLCEWDELPECIIKFTGDIDLRKKTSVPFSSLQIPITSEQQKICAELFINDRYLLDQNHFIPNSRIGLGNKIRIGYFSSDFKDHPVGILIRNIIPLHDRSQFEIYGFFLNNPTGDWVERDLLNSFDFAFNVSQMSDQSVCELVIEQKIDIAIDLNGHTSGSRMALFSRKIAPIQVNYLGYAGTSGAKFFDYLIADKVAIPPEDIIYYTENIAYLPNSFFPIDTSYPMSKLGELPSRNSQQLPEDGFVFACFNNSYKISPEIFEVWMRLLKEIPNSVLWLSKPSERAIANLAKQAALKGIPRNRIIFADRVPNRSDHLNRLRLADLFLDTPNYNAHATAADALWVGVPVLTVLGKTFAGRVAASQVCGLGISEMIVPSNEEYYLRALDIAKNHKTLAEIKNKIEELRPITPLFNTKQYVQDLESLYRNFYEDLNASTSS